MARCAGWTADHTGETEALMAVVRAQALTAGPGWWLYVISQPAASASGSAHGLGVAEPCG
ncbi:Hypothetical predicted protein, partial [Marmota monax]